jgi:hypothetical protein
MSGKSLSGIGISPVSQQLQSGIDNSGIRVSPVPNYGNIKWHCFLMGDSKTLKKCNNLLLFLTSKQMNN